MAKQLTEAEDYADQRRRLLETLDHFARCRTSLIGQRRMLADMAEGSPERAREMATHIAEADAGLQHNAKRTRQIRGLLAGLPPVPEYPPNGFEGFMR